MNTSAKSSPARHDYGGAPTTVLHVSQRSVVRPRSAASANVSRAATLSAPSISSRVMSSTGRLTASHQDSCSGLPRKPSTCRRGYPTLAQLLVDRGNTIKA